MNGPLQSPIESYLNRLYERFRDLQEGAVADYIPELGHADPQAFGLCVATVDGHIYEVGDSLTPFTIQSISKPFVYGLALEDCGKEAVLEKIGVEPTGDAFNEISLEPEHGRPFNPMINAGAIAATSLVAGRSHDDRWNRILALFSMYAGRPLELDEKVYQSEKATGHRNRAISHMLRNFDIIVEDPEPTLDLYFRQCSINVTSRDLAVMAATLATGGLNPITGERTLGPSNVDEVLSVMTTCGMYDSAGEWVYRVGMPAKSGVAGGILAVLPGQLGIGIYSPRLDAHGTSVRGVAVCEAMSEELELHFLRAPRAALSAVRSSFTLRSARSKRVRPHEDDELLTKLGDRVAIFQLQGDLSFGGIEVATRRIFQVPESAGTIVVDLTQVFGVDPPASRILLETLKTLRNDGRRLAFVGLRQHRVLERFLMEALNDEPEPKLIQFEDLDRALEWCEDRLRRDRLVRRQSGQAIPLAQHEVCERLTDSEKDILRSLLERREFSTRELVVRKGTLATELFLLVCGELSVLNDTSSGELQRLSTISPGMCFGELSVVDPAQRTAFVRADGPAVCWVLGHAELASLSERHPTLKIKLLENLLRASSRIISRLSAEAVIRLA